MAGANTVVVHPAPQHMKTVARGLLDLADNPMTDVEYVMWPEPGFRVPEELYTRWESSLATDANGEPALAPELSEPNVFHPVPTGPEIESAVAREKAAEGKPVRKPGRPKKIQGGQ